MILDIIIIFIVGYSTYRGWRRGAISFIGSMIILVASIILATVFGSEFGRAIGAGTTILRPIIGFFLLFVILYLIGRSIRKFLTPKRGILAGLDKLFGLILGFLRAVLILGLLFAFLRIFEIPSVKTATESKAYSFILKTSGLLVHQLKPLAGHLSSDTFESMPGDSLLKSK